MSRRLSPEDRARLQRCRDFVWSSPGFAGLVTGAVLTFIERAHLSNPDPLFLAAFVTNSVLGGAGSAFAVIRLYPVDRGRRWRATGAFVFGIVGTWLAAFFFGCCFSGIPAAR